MFLIILACLIPTYLAVQPQLFTYKVIDGLNLQAAVYTPTTISYERYPVIFLIHGGGYLLGDCIKDAISTREANEILYRGWAIVSVDYRLAPYTFLPDTVQDIIDAYNWVRNDLAYTFPIDRDAIAVWGNSAGGGLAVIAGYKFTPRPKAIVSLYPYCTDFTGSYFYNPTTPVSQELIAKANDFRQPKSKASTSEDIGTRWPFFLDMQAEGKAGWVVTTSDPNESPDDIINTLREYSAIYHIDDKYPPTYLIQGDKDELIPISQSVEMAKVLKEKEVIYELDIVSEARHAFELFYEVPEEAWQKHLEPIFKFVDKHIGKNYWLGEPEAIKIICIHAIVVIIIILTSYLMKRKNHYIKLDEEKALSG